MDSVSAKVKFYELISDMDEDDLLEVAVAAREIRARQSFVGELHRPELLIPENQSR